MSPRIEKRRRHSTVCPAIIWDGLEQGKLNHTGFILLTYLDAITKHGQNPCWATNQHIGRKIQRRSRVVSHTINKLIMQGFLTTTKKPGLSRWIRMAWNPETLEELRLEDLKPLDSMHPGEKSPDQPGHPGQNSPDQPGHPGQNSPGDLIETIKATKEESKDSSLVAAVGKPNGGKSKGKERRRVDPQTVRKQIKKHHHPVGPPAWFHFRDVYLRLWRKKYETDYPFKRGKDSAILRAIYFGSSFKGDIEKFTRTVRRYLACEETFYAGHPLGKFQSALPKFLVQVAGTASRRPVTGKGDHWIRNSDGKWVHLNRDGSYFLD